MKIEDNFCSYDISKQLKSLGFDEECLACFNEIEILEGNHKGIAYSVSNEDLRKTPEIYISAPLYSQVEQWLREKYNIHINLNPQADSKDGITFIPNGKWCGTIDNISKVEMMNSDTICLIPIGNTYQEAREQAIIEALKLI